MGFGENLISIRKEKGVSRKELAERLGIPYTTLRNYETNQREPGHKTLIAIAKLFSVSVDELIGFRCSKHKPAAPKTDTADNIAKRYEKLDNHGKRAVCAIIAEEEFRMIDSRSEAKKSAPEESEADMIYNKAIAKNGQVTPFCVRRGQDKEILEEAKKRVTTNEDSGLD